MLYRAEHFTTNYYLRASKTFHPRLAGVSNRRGVDRGVAMEAFDSRDCFATAAPTGNREIQRDELVPGVFAEHPEPHDAEYARRGPPLRQQLPAPFALLPLVLGHAAVVTQEAGVFLECRRCRAEHG